MKFEYKLNYDFVKEELSFQVTKMEESLRGITDITTIDGWKFISISLPTIQFNRMYHKIYLPGTFVENDSDISIIECDYETAYGMDKVLKKFQDWVEANCPETTVEMTIAEIEEKLGIHNLKIIKE